MKCLQEPTLRRAVPRRWSSLGAATLAGLVVVVPVAGADTAPVGAAAAPVQADAGAAGEGGEAGEAGLAAAAEAEDGYLLQLALMAAHLRVGAEIDAAGGRKAALEHVSNPHHVFYDDLEAEMAEAGDPGIAVDLAQALVMMERDAPAADVAPLFEVMQERLRLAAGGMPPAARLDVAMQLLRTAANEYDFAVTDGTLDDLEEYQDALGFAETARDIAAGVASSDDPVVANAGAKALAAIAATDLAFAGVVPGEGALAGDGSLLMGAAARVELAALALR